MKTLLGLLFLACAVSTMAAPPATLDAHVAFVTTGGYWEDGKPGGLRGQYRVVVTNRGWERVSSHVQLQWILEDPTTESIRVHRTVDVKELNGGFWSVGQPTMNKNGSFMLSATLTTTNEDKQFVLSPTSLGQYKLQSE
jgi:hypothetical protein